MPGSWGMRGTEGWSAVLDALPWPVLVITADDRVAHCNPAYAEAFDRGAPPAPGTPLDDLHEPWNCAAVREALRERAQNPDAPPRAITPPGQRSMQVTVTPLPAGGAEAGSRLVCIDDHRVQGRLQARVRELNERLERLLAHRTAQVNEQAEQLRALTAELLHAEDRERERLAETLHDHLQQVIVAAQLRLHLLDKPLTPERVGAVGEEVRGLLQQAIDVTRSLAVELSPPLPARGGVAAGLRWLSQHCRQQHGLNVALRVDMTPDDAPPALQAFVLRAARELLFNVVKHAGVQEATLTVGTDGDRVLRMTVEDGGRGATPTDSDASVELGFGLSTLRQRAEALGGRLDLESPPGGGCAVRLTLPLPPA